MTPHEVVNKLETLGLLLADSLVQSVGWAVEEVVVLCEVAGVADVEMVWEGKMENEDENDSAGVSVPVGEAEAARDAVSQIEKVAVRDEVEDGSGEALTVGVTVSRGVREATSETEGDTLAVLVLVGDTVAAAESEAQIEKVAVGNEVEDGSGEALTVRDTVTAAEAVSQIEKVAVRDEAEDGSGEALIVGVAVSRGVREATMEMEGDTLAVLVLV